jgi:choline kinase
MEGGISVVILSAGIGARIKSAEPRSLLKIKNEYLINHQIKAIQQTFKECVIIGVFGVHIQKILKKTNKNIRIVENQLYDSTNNSESMRLGLNNTLYDKVLFIHGDIFFNHNLFDGVKFDKSFLVIDGNNDILEKEVGVTINKKQISILSYGLKKKWGQICFLTGKELKTLRNIFQKFEEADKKMLSFEVINKIIENGGSFKYHENSKSHIIEIDCIKDIENENFNL